MNNGYAYFVADIFGIAKYIKTNANNCEILKEINGKLTRSVVNSPYPTAGDENLTEIPKEKYDDIRKQAIN
jgi:Zn-finger domain-containing protein